MTKSIELVLGGARSGKSSYAERIAKQSNREVIYIATSQVRDAEMQSRVDHHKQQRPVEWLVIEEPCLLPEILKVHSKPSRCILVDCLTLWLSNCMFEFPEYQWEERKSTFLASLADLEGQIIFVSNEVGSGIVPMGKQTRQFVDQAGWLHQALAIQVDKVTFVTAGLPLRLKG
jgi:adenosylcobinamide kinase/adenosylcobinamide-phosphate guanylyltransferase